VSQISPPIRIVLVAAIGLMAAYMLFLRPKDEVVPPAEPAPNVQTAEPAVSSPGQVAEAAQGAVDATNQHLQEVGGETGAATTGSTGGATAKGGAQAAVPADLKGVPAPVAKAIGKQQVLVLLFWNEKSADDRAVRQELRKVDDWKGRVYKQAAPIKSISRYGRISRGADVEQSPTVVVVDPELRAETLVGFVDATTIEQAVVDAMRNSTGLYKHVYMREINEVCARYANAIFAQPDNVTPGQYAEQLGRNRARWDRFAADFKAIDAPKRFRSLKRASVRDQAAISAVLADWVAYLGPKPTAARIVNGASRFTSRQREIVKRYDKRMDDANALSCGSQA
jgi:hypothetical protein